MCLYALVAVGQYVVCVRHTCAVLVGPRARIQASKEKKYREEGEEMSEGREGEGGRASDTVDRVRSVPHRLRLQCVSTAAAASHQRGANTLPLSLFSQRTK